MKRLALSLLVISTISSSVFAYSIASKYDAGGDSRSHNYNFTLNCNNGSTGSVTLAVHHSTSYSNATYGATGDGGSYWNNGTDADTVFDKAARDACNE